MLRVDLAKRLGDDGAEGLRVFKGKPDMLVILRPLFFPFFPFFLLFLGLHALDELLLLHGVAHDVQEVDDHHVGVRGLGQGIRDPFVGFAANIYEQIARRNADDVVHRGLVAVEVDAAVEQHRELRMVCLISQNLSCPVVKGEDRRHDPQRPVVRGHRRGGAAAAAGQKCHGQCRRDSQSKYFFHILSSVTFEK